MTPEASLKLRFNNALKQRAPSIHRQSMAMAALGTSGTPDFYYDGFKSDLWVEFKVVKTLSIPIKAKYTDLQLKWMRRRLEHGSNVVGIVGLPDRTVSIQFNRIQWTNGSTDSISLKDAVSWVIDFCGN